MQLATSPLYHYSRRNNPLVAAAVVVRDDDDCHARGGVHVGLASGGGGVGAAVVPHEREDEAERTFASD